MCFNPSPVRRVPSPNRYMAVARFCFCKNNKRTIDQRGDVCCTRQQTGDFCADPFLRFLQCGSCRQARALDAATLRLACQGGEERWRTSRAAVARGERAGCAEHRTGEATYARGRKCENALELRGKRAPAEFPGQAIARESTLAQGDGVLGALGCTQRTRGSRRVGSALEWQGGRRVSAAKTRVGWQEEPHLRGVLVVGFRKRKW